MDHDWQLIRGESSSETDVAILPTLETCARCGLFRLTTISQVFYLVRIGENYIQCSGLTPSVRDQLEALKVKLNEGTEGRNL